MIFGKKIPDYRIYGERIYLKPPVLSDKKKWCALRAASQTFLSPWEASWAEDALTDEGYLRWHTSIALLWEEGRSYSFLIFRKEDDQLLGGFSTSNVRRGIVQSCNVGYWIGAPYVRRGYMLEALGLGIDFIFHALGLRRVEAGCLLNNQASIALLQKTGFQEEGVAREYLCIAGLWQDHVKFALLRQDPRHYVAARHQPPKGGKL